MRLTAIILLSACLAANARGLAQEVTLSVKEAALPEVFAEIRKQTGFNFIYNDAWLANARKITIAVKKAPLTEVLDLCFKGQPFSYTIIRKTISLKPIPTGSIQPPVSNEALAPPLIDISGKVVNEKQEPVEGVSVIVKTTTQATSTNAMGEFTLAAVNRDAVLVFSGINVETLELKVRGKTELMVQLQTKIAALGDVQVTVNTGYERLPKERSTGSFEFINNEQLNRKVGPTLLDRLEGVSPGIFFDKRNLAANNAAVPLTNIMIRGISTLTEAPEQVKQPLIILNNFPYEGNINNINPNDVENITILKDAAAASIYGARAANGVIVITTKQAKFNQRPQLSFNTNVSITDKPDLFHFPVMSTAEFIEVETFLFNKGYYNADLGSNQYLAMSPVVELLNKRKLGQITAADSASRMQALRQADVRNDFDKYIYQRAINEQYYVNLNGGGEKTRYMIGAGVDRNKSSLNGNGFRRFTINTENYYSPVNKLELQLAVRYTHLVSTNNSPGEINSLNYRYRGAVSLYPYAQFADANGMSLSIPKNWREGYTDTAGNGQLLDWKYRPLDELRNADNRNTDQDLVLNGGFQYKIATFLQFSGSYQYQQATGEVDRYFSDKTYYTRNVINLFTNLSTTNPLQRYPVPLGGILDYSIYKLTSHNGRAQLNANHTWSGRHQFNALAGAEIRERINFSTGSRTYGYNESTLSSAFVDWLARFPQYGNRGTSQIPRGPAGFKKLTDHFVSLFGNAAYTFDNRYTISGSVRKDAANLFGVDINNKWKPFWSAGLGWNISNEKFYGLKQLSYLRLRGNYGYMGNVNNSLSPLTIIAYSGAGSSRYNLPFASIRTSANPGLSWEVIKSVNIGLDFQTKGNRISGSFELYTKSSDNLILSSEIDPTTGISTIKRNSASMNGKGMELVLNSVNIKIPFQWKTEFSLAKVKNKVLNYFVDETTSPVEPVLNATGMTITPRKGVSPYGIFSLPFAGLDPATGDPMGYLGKSTSKNYEALLDQLYDTANILYHGSAIPTVFGNFNNLFAYKGLSLAINISYRLGYYFRKNTISYSDLILFGQQHPDYTQRWQKPGDEIKTTVPSLNYSTADDRRDKFYALSSANILKGDNIRLQYIRLGYELAETVKKKIGLRGLQVYALVENLGLIWKANKAGIDPDYDTGNSPYLPPKRMVVGLKLDL